MGVPAYQALEPGLFVDVVRVKKRGFRDTLGRCALLHDIEMEKNDARKSQN